MNKFYLLLLLFFPLFLFSQNLSEDLENRIDFIYELSLIDLDHALEESEKLVNQYENDKYNQMMAYMLLIQMHGAKGENEIALGLCKVALDSSLKYNRYMIPRFKSELVRYYSNNYMYDEALVICEELLRELDDNNANGLVRNTKLSLARINLRINRNKSALKILLEIKDEPNSSGSDHNTQMATILDIANIYIKLDKLDSTKYYLNLFDSQLKLNDPEMLKSMKLKVNGNLKYKESNYRKSIELFNKYLKDYEAFFHIIDLEIILKKCESFYALKNYDSVVSNLNLISSQANFQKILSKKSLGDFYKLNADINLIRGDKKLADSLLILHYEVIDEYNNTKFKTQEGLYEIGSTEMANRSQKTENRYKSYITYITSILSLLLISGIVFFVVKSNKNKKRFGELMATVKSYEEKQDDEKSTVKLVSIVEDLPRNIEKTAKREVNTVEIAESVIEETEVVVVEENKSAEKKNATSHIDSSPIKDEKVQELLEKLEKLKGTGFFLKQECSLYNTAKRLKTNTSYLSSVINNRMQTNFNRYVNDIRMDFVILELKNNKRMRSYSVKGIAEEIGYKSADSFTKYFKESTGLSPSAFIRNLNKEFKL